ncbi:ATP-binding cassette domain-containing protein [Spiroplasma endosymbiont of Aspidapion aeneum]|uniref:ABC transporter ATP-binding protein n=1 Tax=Spiroplasma endosymbiont of Aspidapion aeneum TaxID=3066276 RepID=UPI00313B1189
MVKIKDITKVYGPKNGNFKININIEKGQVYGIVGPNGAGKTTLIRQILGFIKPNSGSITINNLDAWKNRDLVMEFTGYVAGEIALYRDFTGIKYLNLVADYKKNIDGEFVNKLIAHFEIDTKVKIKKMSKGMKQKIAIIAATMHKPSFLVLDEPTSGLDPVMQGQFNTLIAKLKNDYQSTIIICSHIFEEVVTLSNRVGFLKEGSIVDEYEVKENDINTLNAKFREIFKKESIL